MHCTGSGARQAIEVVREGPKCGVDNSDIEGIDSIKGNLDQPMRDLDTSRVSSCCPYFDFFALSEG